MKEVEIKSTILEYNQIEELPKEDIFLIEKAKESAMNAWAPYSNFKVGVALLLENNKVVTGNNQENAAYPSGLCAERVALMYANSKYPDVAVKTIAICAFTNNSFTQKPVPPCGSCRQVVMETEQRFSKPVKLVLHGTDKTYVVSSIKDLLPLNFNSDFIN